MVRGKTVICQYCDRKVTMAIQRPPCEELRGWFFAAHFRDNGSVDNHEFCSLDCLHKWTERRMVRVPEVFLKSFDHEC